jgi:diguanylate cyclase (GGDEF)-like protein
MDIWGLNRGLRLLTVTLREATLVDAERDLAPAVAPPVIASEAWQSSCAPAGALKTANGVRGKRSSSFFGALARALDCRVVASLLLAMTGEDADGATSHNCPLGGKPRAHWCTEFRNRGATSLARSIGTCRDSSGFYRACLQSISLRSLGCAVGGNAMIREQMYAALGATNEAILRTTSQAELFQRVCEAAVLGGGLKSAAALLPETDSWLRIVAMSGLAAGQSAPELRISVSEQNERGQGLAGTAYRTCQSVFTNDFQNDPRLRPWLAEQQGADVSASAAVPILRDGKSVGVFLFFVATPGTLTPDVLALLERMVENVSFALDVFEREEQKRKADRANRRLSDMFAAISATNAAILRSRTREEMFAAVCDSIARGGKSLGAAAILIEDAATQLLEVKAASGKDVDNIYKLQLSTDPAHPRGQGLAGPAFREQALKVSYDLNSDDRTKSYAAKGERAYGGAAVPLTVAGKSVGVLYFFFARTSGTDDGEILKLMQDIGENVSFALAMFDQEDQKRSLSRMYASLLATNEAIMRAQTREELFQLVCEGTVDGAKFSFTAIGLAHEGEDFFELAAVAGPTSERVKTLKFSPRADLPEGRGLTGTAFRTGKPAVSNAYQQDNRSSPWRGMQNGSQAGTALPLMSWGKPVGYILFMSQEQGTFTPPFVELLQRLGDSVAFALENFDRRDEARRAEAQIQHLATHDPLTGLPNRAMFMNLLERAIIAARMKSSQCATLFIDLDRFKVINDSLGHAAGDKLLVEISSRLKAVIGEAGVVARLGGDEFVLILDHFRDTAEVASVARKLLVALAPPVEIAGHQCRTTASIGVAVYPADGEDAQTLTKNADIAMYAAKEDGKNAFRFFSTEIKAQSVDRLALEQDLRQALELDQFVLHYQPKILAASGDIVGLEALVRWQHPQLGLVSPQKFIPLAEETGLIISIGRWVLRTACAQAVAWQREGFPDVSMAVNLSPRQFSDEHLLRDIEEALEASGLDPRLLQLEITESTVMHNVDRAIRILDAIQARGIRLAIDDFGTGYSSMSLMKRFPIDTIKIDRSFVRDLDANKEDRAITTAIITLGRALGLTVVAEGVETSTQQAFLTGEMCDQLQGYLFSKPVPADEVPGILAESSLSLLKRFTDGKLDRRAG